MASKSDKKAYLFNILLNIFEKIVKEGYNPVIKILNEFLLKVKQKMSYFVWI